MKKILLTGGSGFIGSNIIDKIKKKFNVSILVRNKKHIKKFHQPRSWMEWW